MNQKRSIHHYIGNLNNFILKIIHWFPIIIQVFLLFLLSWIECKQLVMVYDVKILLDERLKTIQQLLSTKVFQEVYVCKQLLDEIQDLARMKKFKHIGKTKYILCSSPLVVCSETKLFNKYVYQQQYTQKLNELSDYMKKHSSSSSVLFPIDGICLFILTISSGCSLPSSCVFFLVNLHSLFNFSLFWCCVFLQVHLNFSLFLPFFCKWRLYL